MKKALIIIGIILTIAGLAISAIAMTRVDFNFREFSSEQYIEKTYSENADKIKEITLNDENRRIEIKKSSDSFVHIYYSESEHETYEINLENGKLAMGVYNSRKWYEYLIPNFNFYAPSVRIEIPNDALNSINVTTHNGEIDASEISVKKDLSLMTSNGRIGVNNISCECLTIETHNGKISADRIVADEMKTETENGHTELKYTVVKTLYAEAHNGAIDIVSIDADNISLENNNGRISGTVIGRESDFNITASTSNGHCNLPEKTFGGNKTLNATTHNGAINVTFSAD